GRLPVDKQDALCGENFFTTGNETNFTNLVSNPNYELMRHAVAFPLGIEADQKYNQVNSRKFLDA
ncbi:MAG: hypothetical protein J0653_02725, partial [Deltaproteobacteria bacterium]|nr:hypothetical protein [Deltaproteobacteria bacterium]